MRFTEDVTIRIKPVVEEVKRQVVRCHCKRAFSHMTAYQNHVRKSHGGVAEPPFVGEQAFRKAP